MRKNPGGYIMLGDLHATAETSTGRFTLDGISTQRCFEAFESGKPVYISRIIADVANSEKIYVYCAGCAYWPEPIPAEIGVNGKMCGVASRWVDVKPDGTVSQSAAQLKTLVCDYDRGIAYYVANVEVN